MGPGIQGNREKFTIKWFYLFCIWDIDNQRYLSRNEKLELYMQLNELGAYLTPVPSPTIKTGSLKNLGFKTVDDVLAFAEGPSIQAKTREGIVAWTVDGTFSFKAISNSYLLEKGN